MTTPVYRRFLITIGIGTYRDTGIPDLPAAPTDADRIRKLLTPLGYHSVLPDLATLSARDVPGEIELWAAEQHLDSHDVVVVYFAGHGAKGPDRHYLYWPETIPDRWSTTVATEDLVRPLMHSSVGHLLLVLDACYAAAGGGDATVLASDLVTTHRDATGRSTLSSARPKQTAQEAAFVDALTHTLTHPQTGARQEFLSVREIAERVNAYFRDHDQPQWATHTTVDSDGRVPFFPNPQYIPDLPAGDLDVATLTRLRLRHRGHFEPRGLGVETAADRGDYFTARTTALRELAVWLGSDTHDRRARVITGNPGSGKSSLLGRLMLLTDPDHPARHRTALELLPPAGMQIVPLHAHRASCESLTRDLGAALGLADATVEDVLRALAERTAPVTVLVDALDEAGIAGDSLEATLIGRDLLRHLTVLPMIRLIIGTREPLIKTLGRAITVLDLDRPEHVTHEDVAAYARDVLLDAHDPASLSPYHDQPDLACKVGDAIAARAGTSFLVARMTARALVHDHYVVDTTQAGWRDALPRDAKEAFADYLRRFGPDRAKVERLLRPLAYAQGAGLPWSALWAPMAQALSGLPCPYEDLRWLHEHAGAYIVENLVDGESVFRLFHETMAEHLRTPNQAIHAHHTITNALLDQVATNLGSGRREWADANRYIRDHLATHAAAGRQLDTLITDTDYLVHANPDELLLALHTTTTDQGRLTRSIYLTSAQVHRHLSPAHRRQVLATDAARFGATRQHHLLSEPLSWSTRWATGQMTNSALRNALTGHTRPMFAVACIVVDSQPVAVTASYDHTARVWDLTSGTALHVLTGHADSLRAVACTVVDGQPVAITTSFDGTARVWDLITGTTLHTLTGHADSLHEVGCTVIDGRPVAVTASGDRTARVWDLITGTTLHTLIGHTSSVVAVACTVVDGRPVAVTASRDGTARVWDLTTGTAALHVLTGHTDSLRAVACAAVDGRPVAVTTSRDGTARVWDLTTGTMLHTLIGHADSLHEVACTVVDGQPVAVTVSGDRTARVWDLITGTTLHPLIGHTQPVVAVACTVVDGRPVAVTASDDGTARVWDLITGITLHTLTGHTQPVVAVACTVVDGRPVAVTASRDGTARVWDLITGTALHTLTGHADSLHDVACTDIDGRPVAITTSQDNTARIWDLITGTTLHTLTGHTRQVDAVACTDIDGRPVAVTISDDGTARIWDLTTGITLHTLTGHTGSVVAVACAVVDGRPVAITTSQDNTVRVWDLTTGTMLHTLIGHTRPVDAVACTDVDGRPVAITTSYDNTARIWDLVSGAELMVHHFLAPLSGLMVGPGSEVVIGVGWDIAVINKTSPEST